uniref:Uncharacterized protein n=1 Tax=Synechococcus phage S-CAM8 TaxID=754038 RepID=G8EY18_9CAUD
MATNLNTGLNFGLNPGLRQSISGGVADSLGLFRSSSLDLRFADKRTLADRVSGNNLITFSRASGSGYGATYVDSDGLIKTSPVNLVYPSESIDVGVGLWTSTASSGTISVTPNSTESPYGTTTATRVVATKAGTGYGVFQARPNIPSTPSVGSIWIKSNTGSNQTIYFRLDLGGAEDYNLTVTPEWQRYQMVEDEAAGLTYFSVGLRGGSDASCDISIWGAQVEEGTTATDYIPTGATISGAPRFDHDPVTGESLGLLIEEGRTNVTRPSDFSSLWNYTSPGDGIKQTAYGLAPDGSTSSIYLQPNSAARVLRNTSGSGITAGTYTVSLFYKGDKPIGVGGPGVNGGLTDVANYGNGWKRAASTLTFTGGGYLDITVLSGTSVELWGIQSELGSFPTSYIPTSGSTVTRAPDIASIEGNKFAKTNLLEYSNYSQVNVSSTATLGGTTTAPDGTNTARVYSTSLTSAAINKLYTNGVVGKDYTFSFYVRSTGSASQVRVFVGDAAVSEFKNISTEWQRVSVTKLNNASNIVRAYVTIYAGDEIELWGAQLEEGSELTEYTPSVESFDSRASSATYVDDATGLIKTTPVNFILNSDFPVSSNTSATQNDVNNITTPAGITTTVKQLTAPFTGFTRYGDLSSGTPGTTYTGSIYVRTVSGTDTITIDVVDGPSKSYDITETWQRIDASGSVSANYRFFDLNLSNSDIYIWGAQLEEGTTATPYIKTTNTISGAARYENGELLLEPARTNVIDRNTSNYNSIWTNIVPSGAYNNAGIAPDGTNTAFATTAYAPEARGQKNYSMTADTNDYTFSIFIKSTGGQGQYVTYKTGFNFGDQDTLNQTAYDFATDTVGAGYSRKLYANGWVRIWKTYTNTNLPTFLTTNRSSTSLDMLFWGAQLEQGSYPSSLIITPVGANVTRAADVSTSALGVDSWYNQSEGTVFAIAEAPAFANTVVASLASGSNNDKMEVRSSASNLNNSRSTIKTNAATVFDSSLSAGAGSYRSLALGYKLNDTRYAVDGSLGTLDTSVTLPSVNRLYLGNEFNNTYVRPGHITRLAYFPTRKTDQELVKITDGTLDAPIITYGITSAGGTFNLRSLGTVDYAVDWDSTGGYESSTSNTLAHTYTAGDYNLVVYSNDVYRPYFDSVTADVGQITSVVISSGANLGTDLGNAWRGASNMTSFVCPSDVTSGVTNFTYAWSNCSSLTSFPQIDTGNGTNFSRTWFECSGLSIFPLIDTSSGTSFSSTWNGCSGLSSFPAINVGSGTSFFRAWFLCSGLSSFPANMFDATGTLSANAFNNAWFGCALTAQSIENILVSLDTNGASNITLGISGGTNAAKSTWSAAAVTAYDNLIAKGWTITFNA